MNDFQNKHSYKGVVHFHTASLSKASFIEVE